MSEKSKVCCQGTFVLSSFASIGTWESSDRNSITQGTELRPAELNWTFSPFSVPLGLISFILQCNYWWGTFLLSEFIRFVTSLFLGLLIWIALWLLLLNVFHIIPVSNLLVHPVAEESGPMFHGHHPEHLSLPPLLLLTGPTFISISTS